MYVFEKRIKGLLPGERSESLGSIHRSDPEHSHPRRSRQVVLPTIGGWLQQMLPTVALLLLLLPTALVNGTAKMGLLYDADVASYSQNGIKAGKKPETGKTGNFFQFFKFYDL